MQILKQETEIVEVPKPKIQIRSIVVDTFTAFQKNQVFDKWEDGKVKLDEWKDFGVEMVNFVRALISMGFTCVGVVGGIGTGKSYGMKKLPSKTNIWFNADDKECTYKGGKAEYGTREEPTPFQIKAKSYDDVIKTVEKIKGKGRFAPRPIAFLIGHTEEYKSGDTTRQRLKTIGKISKMEIEDMLTMCYYTEVTPNGIGADYKLRTQNNGRNNGRTMEEQHKELFIDNDFSEIIRSFDAY